MVKRCTYEPFDKGDSPLDPGPCRPVWMPRRLCRGTKESIRAWKQSGEVQWCALVDIDGTGTLTVVG